MKPHRMKVDDALAYGLDTFAEPLELIDAKGNVVGVFTPSPEQRRRIYDEAMSQVSDEELEQMATQTEGCTTAELLEKLSRL